MKVYCEKCVHYRRNGYPIPVECTKSFEFVDYPIERTKRYTSDMYDKNKGNDCKDFEKAGIFRKIWNAFR